jgi:hypothetical protein
VSKQLVLGRAEHAKARAMQVTEGEIEAQRWALKYRNADSVQTMIGERLWQALAEQGNAGKG